MIGGRQNCYKDVCSAKAVEKQILIPKKHFTLFLKMILYIILSESIYSAQSIRKISYN